MKFGENCNDFNKTPTRKLYPPWVPTEDTPRTKWRIDSNIQVHFILSKGERFLTGGGLKGRGCIRKVGRPRPLKKPMLTRVINSILDLIAVEVRLRRDYLNLLRILFFFRECNLHSFIFIPYWEIFCPTSFPQLLILFVSFFFVSLSFFQSNSLLQWGTWFLLISWLLFLPFPSSFFFCNLHDSPRFNLKWYFWKGKKIRNKYEVGLVGSWDCSFE